MCRGAAEAQRERSEAISEVVRETQTEPSPSSQQYDERRESNRVTSQEIQARIQHVKAAIEAAKAANRPESFRTEVSSS